MTDVTGLALVGAGRTADVYAIDGGRVLRRYRDGASAASEAAVMTHVRAHGFPAPAVHEATGPDLVLDHLAGPTLLQALLDGERTAAGAATILAGLHHRLHAVPPSGHPRPAGPAAGTVVHLDLHPDNVVLTPDGPVLIDWRNATDGPADLDVVYSALILAQVSVGTDAVLAPVAAALIGPFLAAAGGTPLDHLAAATARRGADPQLTTTERERLAAAAALVAEEARRTS
ncbi:phosphotransferase [Jiangella alba]|uniref:Phosphotransferase enzyme family protein n=1 Tax=Jiangella alba TaxID=561176 RepID=A0A1H5IZK2_9ACTN|nr:phosphotransferase [Jiangella alba]SEE45656.1 Phosphotransferase enzyme family protein [Jiangella alba]